MAENELQYKTGNFEFVRFIYPDLCDLLQEAEADLYCNSKDAGLKLRDALEELVNQISTEAGISFPAEMDVFNKLKQLGSEKRLPEVKGEFKYKSERKGERTVEDPLFMWRMYGNRCHHWKDPKPKPHYPVITRDSAITALKAAYCALKEIYRNRCGAQAAEQLPPFDPYCMPIKEQKVLRSRIPEDKAVSRCVREFETCSTNADTGRFESFGIVRMYEKEHMDERMLHLRDQEAFSEAAFQAGIAFDGNVQLQVLANMRERFSDYYIVLYKFMRYPRRLNNTLLMQMPTEAREVLCRRLADILYCFHTLQTPVYHRNLSYDSVYICDGADGQPEPSIIKLDYAKIDSVEFGTVISNVKNAKEMMQHQKIMKYTPPEVRLLMQSGHSEVSWDKADVYALGVLFGDVLSGDIGVNPVRAAKLMHSGADVTLVQLIDRMCHPKAELRPSMKTVRDILMESEQGKE